MREVVSATRLGQKPLARILLHEILEEDPGNEQALLWAAALAESTPEANGYLERVLAVNPNNQQAINILAASRLSFDLGPKPEAVSHPLLKPRHEPVPEPEPELVEEFLEESEAPEEQHQEPLQEEVAAESIHPASPEDIAAGHTPEPANVESLPAPHSLPVVAPPAPARKTMAFKEMLRQRWRCPLCKGEALQPQRRCGRCGALLSLEDLQALAENRGVDEKLLLQNLDELEARATSEPDAATFSNIARILMNLNRSAEALVWIRKSLEADSSDFSLDATARSLEARPLLLAVDDSSTLRKILSIMLERKGFRVLTAADGMQALARLDVYTPDLILLDITMPKMDGYEVCKLIRQAQHTKEIPVVMLSGNDGFFDKVKGKLAGAADYVTKPFEDESLTRTVKKYIKKRKEKD
jgi:twitching motility two-component system response regulator PilG